MIVMCMESYQQSATTDFVLMSINNLFIFVFTVECLMKLLALNWRFFIIPWNVFDMIIVIFSLSTLVFESYVRNILNFSPTVLRIVRVVRVGRVLRLVKGARGIRTLLFALAISLPALFNIGLLLFLIIFIYGIFGKNLFIN
jgi:voltage-gated sodium channel type II alpha